jgi:type IV pilus assembly protein PilA
MRRQQGFTLMELLIVITLILIIAAITIPSLTKAKINANEASAVGSLRAINQAEVSYQAAFGGFADSLANLGGVDPCSRSAATACLLDQSLAGGVKDGYHFSAVGFGPATGSNTTFLAGAAPVDFDHTGQRLFCTTDKNVIRVDLNTRGSTVPPDSEQCVGFKAL